MLIYFHFKIREDTTRKMLRFFLFSLAIFMLVALTHLSQGETTTELPFLVQRIKKNIKTQMKIQIDTGNSGFKTISNPPTGAATKMRTTTMEPQPLNALQSFIEAPNRCLPGSDFIRGSCRIRINWNETCKIEIWKSPIYHTIYS